MFLDVIKFLDEYKLSYSKSGKNIGRGWMGIKYCPFCGDKNYHLGVHKKTANISCWKCKTKGWFYDYVMEEFKCDRNKAKKYCHPFINFNKNGFDKEVLDRPTRTKLPEYATKEFPQCHKNYLFNRGFTFETIQRFDLYAVFMESMWRYRVIIPIYYDGKLVSFTARAISKEMEPRYLHSSNEISVIPVKQTLYNVDMVTDHIILCEGPTDVWKMGTGAVATFGTQFTNRQLCLLKRNGAKKATILFDPDKGGKKAARDLLTACDFIGIEANYYKLTDCDPGDLTFDEVYDLRKEILS